MKRKATAARHKARCLLIQALYQWQLTGDDPGDIFIQFVDGRDLQGADEEYFRQLMRAIPGEVEALDHDIAPLLERSPAMIDPIERAVLWLACHELHARPEVPVRVVIDEAVELSKKFGSGTGHRFVNGVVDRLAHRIRSHELGPATGPR